MPSVEIEARLLQRRIDVATDDRLDVVDRGFLGALAELVRDAVRDDDGHDDDDCDRGRDDDRADAQPPMRSDGGTQDGTAQETRGHGAGRQRTNMRSRQP